MIAYIDTLNCDGPILPSPVVLYSRQGDWQAGRIWVDFKILTGLEFYFVYFVIILLTIYSVGFSHIQHILKHVLR